MSKSKTFNLSWEPVRHGDRYCAPACGGGCTFAAYQRAHKDAKKLARRLGTGWTTDVWENLDWHWRVRSACQRITLTPCSSRWWMALLCDAGTVYGRYSAIDKTPEKAVAAVFAAAKADLARIGASIKGL